MGCYAQFRYIIRANGMKALAVHSDLSHFEFVDYIKSQCVKLHPEGNDVVWKYGTIEFVNPVVQGVDDFANFCPALIGIK